MGYNNGHFWTFSKQEERKNSEDHTTVRIL